MGRAPARSRYCSRVRAHGPQASRPSRVRVHRGSRKRVARIRLKGNGSMELCILIVVLLLALLVIMPRLIRAA